MQTHMALKTLLTDLLGTGIAISTVDAFQGSEMDIIIVCTVRANDKNGVGFLSNFQRLNVSITRAKKALIIVGNAHCLAYGDQSGLWWSLCCHLRDNHLYFDVNLRSTFLNLKEPVFIEEAMEGKKQSRALSIEASVWRVRVFDKPKKQSANEACRLIGVLYEFLNTTGCGLTLVEAVSKKLRKHGDDSQVDDVFEWNRKDFSHSMSWAHLGFGMGPS